MKNIKLFAGFVFLLVLAACQQPGGSNAPGVSGTLKTLDGDGYTLQYPDSFELDDSGRMGAIVFLLSKQTSPEDLFRENINLIVQELPPGSMDLQAYADLSEDQVKQMITKASILESHQVKKGERTFHRIVYTGTQGEFDLWFEQHYHIVENKAYVITLTCEQNQADKYGQVGENIMNSLRIK